MTKNPVFHPDARVCKSCDQIFPLDDEMRPRDPVECQCGALGAVEVFPCSNTKCDCGGWWGIAWDGFNYGRQEQISLTEIRDVGISSLEAFLRKAFTQG